MCSELDILTCRSLHLDQIAVLQLGARARAFKPSCPPPGLPVPYERGYYCYYVRLFDNQDPVLNLFFLAPYSRRMLPLRHCVPGTSIYHQMRPRSLLVDPFFLS